MQFDEFSSGWSVSCVDRKWQRLRVRRIDNLISINKWFKSINRFFLAYSTLVNINMVNFVEDCEVSLRMRKVLDGIHQYLLWLNKYFAKMRKLRKSPKSMEWPWLISEVAGRGWAMQSSKIWAEHDIREFTLLHYLSAAERDIWHH